MRFVGKDKLPTSEEISKCEGDLGLIFPSALRSLFLENNGGQPELYVYQDEAEDFSAVVNETLPLITEQDRGTALETYVVLVLEKKLTSPNFFPFAVDPGGDYFFVDCDDADSAVYFFISDSASPGLRSLNVSLDDFWSKFVSEQDSGE